MPYHLKVLSDKSIPESLDKLCELIEDVFNEVKMNAVNPIFTKEKYLAEYGFTIENYDKKVSIFFGLWHELWEYSGIPLCLTLDWKTPICSFQETFEEFCMTQSGLTKTFNFEMYPTSCFDMSYIEELKDHKPIVTILKNLCEQKGFQTYFR